MNGARDQYDGLLDLIGDARFVLIGEASHGTHEFDVTGAVEPLDHNVEWQSAEVPETVPSGV